MFSPIAEARLRHFLEQLAPRNDPEILCLVRDPFDFMKSVKVPKSSRLEADGQRIQNTTRYYVSTDGVTLKKIMPGLKDGPEREFAVEKGWTVTVVNDASRFDWSNVNWLYYAEEARKLLI